MPIPSRHLYRSTDDRVIAGVAGGLAEYFQVDSTLVRLTFATLTFVAGLGIILYILGWLVIPVKDQASILEEFSEQSKPELEEAAHRLREEFNREMAKQREKRRVRHHISFGVFLILVGIIILLITTGYLTMQFIKIFWPVILILIGLRMLARR